MRILTLIESHNQIYSDFPNLLYLFVFISINFNYMRRFIYPPHSQDTEQIHYRPPSYLLYAPSPVSNFCEPLFLTLVLKFSHLKNVIQIESNDI